MPRTEQYRTSLIHGRFVGCDFLEIAFAAVVGKMVPRLGKLETGKLALVTVWRSWILG